MTSPHLAQRNPDTPPEHVNIYDSAIDLWIATLIFLGPASACVLGIVFSVGGKPAEASILFLTAAATLIVTVALTLPCRYTILDDALSIRCGLMFYQIDLRDIRRVEPTASLRSGPALSLRRVLITTDRRKHILSPKDRDRFIQQLSNAVRRVNEDSDR